MRKLQPITKELFDSLSGWDRIKAIEQHHTWLKKVRKQDKKVDESQVQRVERFQFNKKLMKINLGKCRYEIYLSKTTGWYTEYIY